MIDLLSFPGYFAVDAHGFIKQQDEVGFQFASQSTSLTIFNDKNVTFLHSTKSREALYNFFKPMTGPEFLTNWFQNHDAISDLMSSGYSPKRICTMVIFYEPTSQSVKELFN